MRTEHVHEWKLPEGSFVVIDTSPPQYPYGCECGAFTHDPETGEPCSTCHPADYDQRSSRRVLLEGGPFDGTVIAEPRNSSVWFRAAPPGQRAQKAVNYKRSPENRAVFKFSGNIWTVPLVSLAENKSEATT